MKTYSETISLVEQFAEGLKQRFGDHIAKVMLIGSYARGDYREDSDVDVVVLLNSSPRELRDKIYDYLVDFSLEHDRDIALKLIEQATFDQWKQWRDPFSLAAETEGVVL